MTEIYRCPGCNLRLQTYYEFINGVLRPVKAICPRCGVVYKRKTKSAP